MLETTHDKLEEIPEHLSVLCVPDSSGDTKHMWNPKNEAEVEAARVLFESLVAKGYRAFLLKRWHRKGAAVDEFNSEDGKLLFKEPEPEPEVDGEMVDEFQPEGRTVMRPQMAGG